MHVGHISVSVAGNLVRRLSAKPRSLYKINLKDKYLVDVGYPMENFWQSK